jgi:hypothetical protein
LPGAVLCSVRRGLAALVVALAAMLLPLVAAAEPAARVYSLELPHRLAGLEFRQVIEYPDPRLGVSANYARPPLFADMYLYDLGQTGITDGESHPVVAGSYAQAKREIETLTRYRGLSVDLVREDVLDLSLEGERHVRYLRAVYQIDEQSPYLSLLLVTGGLGKVVKLRISLLPGATQDDAAAVQPFVTAVSQLIAR